MKRILPFIVTIAALVVTLATYLVPVPAIAALRPYLVRVAVIVAAFAMLLGALNLASVHLNRLFRQRPGWAYSLVLLIVLVAILAIGLVQGLVALTSGQPLVQAYTGGVMMLVYQYLLIPIQTALAALLPFFLAFAAYRTLRVQRTARTVLGAFVFLATAILVLLGQIPLLNQAWLAAVRDWIVRVPAMAGMRGILLGVALGITATALRVLIGADRPASD